MDIIQGGTFPIAIDGKHIRIISPGNSGSFYFNYKDFHSIVILVLVDHNYKFLATDVGSYGEKGDAGIFAKSPLGKNLSNTMKFLPPEPLPGTRLFYLMQCWETRFSS
jgi:hypothetical protein